MLTFCMQNFQNRFLFFLLLLIFFSCEVTTPEYYHTRGGLKYKYHDIVPDGKVPKEGDYLSVYMTWETEDDSVFYNSWEGSYEGTDLIVLQKTEIIGGIEEGFAMLKEGDSVTFYIDPNVFYESYLKKSLPSFLKQENEMKISMRLLKIQSQKEYEYDNQIWLDELEVREYSLVKGVLEKWKMEGDSIFDYSGVYVVYDSIRHDSDYVHYMDVVRMNYTAEFVNGKVFYNTYKNGGPDEFQLGKPDQTVEGLKTAISATRYGQKAKVLIPSNLGFGEKGSAGNIVPPFTPVIYRIEILKKDTLEVVQYN